MYITSATKESILEAILSLRLQKSETVFIGVAEGVELNLHDLIQTLNQRQIPFFGGLFPAVIGDGEKQDLGVIIKRIATHHKPIVVEDLANANVHSIQRKIQSKSIEHSAFCFVDGLADSITSFLRNFQSAMDLPLKVMGGGAGSLSLKRKPCLFTNEGLFENAAIIVFSSLEMEIGVRHGWHPISDLMLVTKSYKNVIEELNWLPAFEVYKHFVSKVERIMVEKENFFGIAKHYPLALCREVGEDLVRDPIMVGKHDELICVGEVPQNAALRLLNGNEESLVQAASHAARASLRQKGTPADSLVIDCISRALFLEGKYKEEISAISKVLEQTVKSDYIEGVLTLGEIASHGDGLIDFYNKTIVIGTRYDK
ncbi:MAG: FIST N-terminal domain-containing protein [Chloroherpetonaceae bacterium]|nr:FIST N-terminal domain-containing protein [Chloroherpetonaceae bacterium]